ncbi:PrsW family intramembrane metalloprotease [Lactobacillus sp. S2-2]|uniref:PrsW family intramembrane metalloprotease n=1 Tax=Lactobacillus sp. S2-2 TaxID=2692917 RepID=UPI001F01E914|nr:PrsW family glutamic-type intramembrane protease [Lactobacillus sp. S2-2]MCF6515266.1 PrsW family intramembrane metalloprotease [Lactobacillus sp. S2-2]
MVRKTSHIKRLANLKKIPISLVGVKRNYDRILNDTTKSLNEWTGNYEAVEIHLGRMFSQVFQKHSKDEEEQLFISGTKTTTPSLKKVSSAPVKPWFFSRVFALLGFSFLLLWCLMFVFSSDKVSTGLTFIGSLTVPMSLLMLFFEINVYRNLSFMKIFEIFLIGGILAIIATMILYDIVPISNDMNFWAAFLIGFVEETAKLLIIIYYTNQFKIKYIFNGMLIGAAIGAGFSVIENAGYTSQYGLITLLIRSWQTIGTHTIWAAILGAAVVIGKKTKAQFSIYDFSTKIFFRFYLFVILLHTFWDWTIPFDIFYYCDLQKILLILIGWMMVIVLIDAGLREVRTLQGQRIIERKSRRKKRLLK